VMESRLRVPLKTCVVEPFRTLQQVFTAPTTQCTHCQNVVALAVVTITTLKSKPAVVRPSVFQSFCFLYQRRLLVILSLYQQYDLDASLECCGESYIDKGHCINCGGDYVSDLEYKCCDEVNARQYPPNVNTTLYSCCSNGLVGPNDLCCDNTLITGGAGLACCSIYSYNTTTHFCSSGDVKEYSYCDGVPYDDQAQHCCGTQASEYQTPLFWTVTNITTSLVSRLSSRLVSSRLSRLSRLSLSSAVSRRSGQELLWQGLRKFK